MKGTPRPTWSEGRQRWLRKLKAGAAKPKGTGEGSTATYCRALGWTRIDTERRGHVLTAEGMATLARWEGGDTRPPGQAPAPTRNTFARLLQHEPAELVTRLLDMGEPHARAVYEALHTALFGFMPPPGPHYHQGGMVGKLPDGHVPRIIEAGNFVPGGQSTDLGPRAGEVAAILREGVAAGEIGADPGMEVGGTSHGRGAPGATAAIEAQPVRAPQYGIQPSMAASLGKRTTPRGFSECLQCRGRGVVAHNFQCPACHGAGTIRRTVEL